MYSNQRTLDPDTLSNSTLLSIRKCAANKGCQSCVGDPGCGYFYNTGECVPGGWLAPLEKYAHSGASWSYYHGHCLVSTRVEYVVMPSVLVLATLIAAIIALWRRWSLRRGDTRSCSSSQASISSGNAGHCFHHSEHTPLLIDNDPGSRPDAQMAAGSLARGMRSSNMDVPVPQNEGPLGEHYGSWYQRTGSLIQSSLPKNTI
ncbi:hypothetical protein GGF37_001730 [Kickxella alabastrina]|nr:hypothetical protein GGF37_001730 [Kickxella alabastrina]